MMKYKNYIFDLYGILVYIKTDEENSGLWNKLALFYGYYDAIYKPEELNKRYMELVHEGEVKLGEMESDVHEAHQEIKLEEVFKQLYIDKGVKPSEELVLHTGQFFRVLTTEYIKLYDGVVYLLEQIKKLGGNIYLL